MSIANIIEKWDGCLYQSYNFIMNIQFYINYLRFGRLVSRNNKLKDKHQGERCFIIMNGPSINNYDLSKLRNEFVFCSNFFYRSNLMKVVRPNYYCWADSKIFDYPNVNEIFDKIRSLSAGVQFILNAKGYGILDNSEDIYYARCKQIPNVFSVKSDYTRNVSNYATVAFHAINAAIFMGFKEIYVMGLDFEPGAFKHFSNIGSECEDPNKNIDKDIVCSNYWNYTKAHYESYYIEEHARKKGCIIYNLNANSCIRAFRFADYNDLFA